MPTDATQAAGWFGLALLSVIFFANALGIVDQSAAIRELAAAGLPARFARAAVVFGRVFQLAAASALFIGAVRPYAALGLMGFLMTATLAAHAFWRAPLSERSAQLAGFLKNIAILGGLAIAASWKSHA